MQSKIILKNSEKGLPKVKIIDFKNRDVIRKIEESQKLQEEILKRKKVDVDKLRVVIQL